LSFGVFVSENGGTYYTGRDLIGMVTNGHLMGKTAQLTANPDPDRDWEGIKKDQT
jgi:hypothetical protein